MMKHLFSAGAFFAAMATTTQASAQVQIQNLNPVAGDEFKFEYFDLTVADSGSIGNNQVWDFSGASSTGSTNIKTYRALTAQEQSDYPTANLAYTEDGDPTVNLLHVSADSLADYGPTDFMYTNPIVYYKYPINSNSYSFTDVSGISNIPMVQYSGTLKTYSQGTGTLITPFGRYENVIKLRRKGYMTYNAFGDQDQITVDGYVWVNADNKTELLNIERTKYASSPGEDDMEAYILKNGAFAGLEQLSENYFSVYPNPSRETVYVKSAGEMPASYKIFSVTGTEVQSGTYNAQGISTSKLTNGEYIIRLETTSGSFSHVRLTKI